MPPASSNQAPRCIPLHDGAPTERGRLTRIFREAQTESVESIMDVYKRMLA